MPIPFSTSRLLIRAFRDADFDAFFAYRNDPEVARYQGWQVPYSAESARDFIAQMKLLSPAQADAPGWYQMALERLQTGQTIGDVGFSINPHQQRVRIGYTIARAHWGQGYASEAIAALLGYIFHELKLHRVLADCSPENIGSVRVLEKLGFRREAHFVESYRNAAGVWEDEYQYALLAREWSQP